MAETPAAQLRIGVPIAVLGDAGDRPGRVSGGGQIIY